jgi:hypothetical protein
MFHDLDAEQGEGKVPWANSKARTMMCTTPMERVTILLENNYNMHADLLVCTNNFRN